jgi:hypothetical protein
LRVLNITTTDTGGTASRTRDAFARHRPDWVYDFVATSPKYMRYPVHRSWRDAPELWEAADVIHYRNSFALQQSLRAPDRPSVILHHGTNYRALHEHLIAEAARRRAITTVSTLDLWLIHPDDSEWLPSLYDLDWLAGFRRPREDDGVLRIAHAPTDRKVKSTARFLAAVERLRGDGVNVELDVIEKAEWGQCLTRKGAADVYFDQVQLGYGNNAIECMAMGIPVIAGAAEDTRAEMVRRFGSLPFVEATEGTIYEALRDMVDPDLRDYWGSRGHAHVRQWHDEKVIVDQLVDLYTRAVERW